MSVPFGSSRTAIPRPCPPPARSRPHRAVFGSVGIREGSSRRPLRAVALSDRLPGEDGPRSKAFPDGHLRAGAVGLGPDRARGLDHLSAPILGRATPPLRGASAGPFAHGPTESARRVMTLREALLESTATNRRSTCPDPTTSPRALGGSRPPEPSLLATGAPESEDATGRLRHCHDLIGRSSAQAGLTLSLGHRR